MVCEKLVERAFRANELVGISKRSDRVGYSEATRNEIEMMDISLFKKSVNVSHRSCSREVEVGDVKVDIRNGYLK